MQKDLIRAMTDSFEGHAQETENGIECWLARDVQHLLGYKKWENFLNVISKAKTACETSGYDIEDHFPDVRKMVELGSGSQREIVSSLIRQLTWTHFTQYLPKKLLSEKLHQFTTTAKRIIEDKKVLKNPNRLNTDE